MGLPLALLDVRLRLRPGARFHFFHGPAIYAFLMDRLGRPDRFPDGAWIWPVECGRVLYDEEVGYRFGLVVSEACVLGIDDWRDLLRSPPRTRFGKTGGAPFGAGLRLEGLVDATTGRWLGRGRVASPWDEEALAQAAAPLVGGSELEFCFTSPVRILRTPVKEKRFVLDDRVFLPEVLLRRCQSRVARLLPGLAASMGPVELPGVRLLDNAMVRADASYTSKRVASSKGSVRLGLDAPVTPALARTLVLAGLVGVGQATAMGLGRFCVAGQADAAVARGWPPRPTQTLLERAAGPSRLAAARERMARAGRTPGVDEVAREAFVESLSFRMEALSRRLGASEVRPEPLRGVVLQRADGRVRALAVPTMEDRFLQRAVVEELDPAVDQLLEDSSFAYRKGLSRRSAEAAIRRARDEGYTHVLDADVRAFFDEVDWGLLERRLRAYFGADPAVDLLMAWTRAPVHYAGERIARDRGLPQGAVSSPLLANFFLDGLDERVEQAGFRLVRYADDFVVLCRTAAEVAAAQALVEAELARLGLALAQDKTRATSFDRGFRFVGLLFCRTVVLEPERGRPRATRVDEEGWSEAVAITPDKAALCGWLGALVGEPGGGDGAAAEGETRWRRAMATRGPARRPVYVVDGALRLAAGRRGLRLYRGGALVREVAWQQISEVAVVGSRPCTQAFYQQAMRHRIPVTFYSRGGKVLGTLLPAGVRSPSPTSLAQWRWQQVPGQAMAVARALVEAKIHNQRLVARRQPGANTALLARLDEAAKAALRAETPERLRGIEGRAAHDYFAAWPGWLGEGWAFPRRSGRGARDPINAVLNLLYTQLFRLCWQDALSHGLDPFLGVLHDGRGRYAALAADLQEPFRFLCERLVLESTRRGRLTPVDFIHAEKSSEPVRLRPDALRMVLGDWERRLVAEVQVPAARGRHSYRAHIRDQAVRLAAVVSGERADVGAFRLKW